MMDAIKVLGLAGSGMLLLYAGLGYEAAYEISYGAFTLMAAMVSLTFLWLWMERATPLAIGMAFGWAGAASVMGWWWVYHILDNPAQMRQNAALFLCLSVYFVGAILHFAVIGRSLGLARGLWLAPVALAIAVSVVLHVTGF
jgi:hypothetical protein